MEETQNEAGDDHGDAWDQDDIALDEIAENETPAVVANETENSAIQNNEGDGWNEDFGFDESENDDDVAEPDYGVGSPPRRNRGRKKRQQAT